MPSIQCVGWKMNGQFTLQQAEQLLNFDAKLDVNLLDAVVHCFYDSLGEEVGVHRCRVGGTVGLFSCVLVASPAVGSYRTRCPPLITPQHQAPIASSLRGDGSP